MAAWEKKDVHLLLPELRRCFFSLPYLGCMLLSAAFKIMDLMSQISIMDYFTEHIKTNALYLMSLGGNDNILRFAAFCFCAFPSASMYAEDYEQNAVYMRVQRLGRFRYALSRVLSVLLSAGLCMFLAEVLCMGILVLMGNDMFPAEGAAAWENSHFLEEGRYISYWFLTVGIRSMEASFYALLALGVSTVIPNRYAVAAFPMLTCYIAYFILVWMSFLPDWIQPRIVYISLLSGGIGALLGIGEWQGFHITVLYTFLAACLVMVFLYRALGRRGTFGNGETA